MNLKNNGISIEKAAIYAGIGLILMAIIAPIVNFNILQGLIISEDPAIATENIQSSEGLFRLGIYGFLIVAILDIIVAWGLHIILKSENEALSLLTAWFRLIYAAILAIALFNLLNVLTLLDNSNSQLLFKQDELQAQVMLAVNAFNRGWDFGLIIFGLHLLLLGYLIYKSDYFPRFLGLLVSIAGLGYTIDSSGNILSANYNISIAMFTFIGEVLLIFWLILRGIKGFNNKGEKS